MYCHFHHAIHINTSSIIIISIMRLYRLMEEIFMLSSTLPSRKTVCIMTACTERANQDVCKLEVLESAYWWVSLFYMKGIRLIKSIFVWLDSLSVYYGIVRNWAALYLRWRFEILWEIILIFVVVQCGSNGVRQVHDYLERRESIVDANTLES